MKKMDLELMCKIAQDITDTLEKYDNEYENESMSIAAHQLEALNLVLGYMLFNYEVPIGLSKKALEMAYRQARDRYDEDTLH
jgi:hypothetical protein